MEHRQIRIRLLQHSQTGLLAAVSDDLYGLTVVGNNQEDIARQLPSAIRSVLEAQGYKVGAVTTERDDRESRAGFGLPAFIADAAIAAAG